MRLQFLVTLLLWKFTYCIYIFIIITINVPLGRIYSQVVTVVFRAFVIQFVFMFDFTLF